MSDNLNYLYTAGAYAALIGAGYAIYQISTSKTRRRMAAQPKPSKPAEAGARKDDRKKKQRMETFASDAQEASRKAAKAAKAAKAESKSLAGEESQSWVDVAVQGAERDDGISNKEFAKQLAKAQEGHKLASKKESGGSGRQSQKSVKQSKANKIDGHSTKQEAATTPPADDNKDDGGPEVPPPVVKAADPGGVADMLEPAPAAPSVLRLTSTEEKAKKPAKTKAPEQTETKKQRQNRKKAEAAKAAREEAEKDRKVLEEQQRRQARIAEGRAAKDGSQFTNASVSQWTQGAPNGVRKPSNGQALFQPLDTFDQPSGNTAPTEPAGSQKASDLGDSWTHTALPSEEEQLEILKDNADEWNTVKTKGAKKPKKAALDHAAVSDPAGGETAASAPAPAQPAKATKQMPKPAGRAAANKNLGGSFAALSSHEVDEEVEEEWDV